MTQILLAFGLALTLGATSTSIVKASSIPDPPEKGIHLDDVFEQAIGNGVSYNQDKDLLQMSSGAYQTGAIWSKDKIDVRKKFTLEGYIYLGNQGSNAADGMTFTLQSDNNHFLGERGQYLGMYGTSNHYYAALEFDTYYNGDNLDDPDQNSGLTQKGQHIGITTGGTNYHYAKTEFPKNYAMSNNSWKKITVSGTPISSKNFKLSYTYKDMGTGRITSNDTVVYFDGKGDSNGAHNFLNSPYVYWGFTSATGEHQEVNALTFGKIPQKASIQTKDTKIYKGQTWDPESNFISATDEYGNSIKFSDPRLTYTNNVNTQKVGKYNVTYSYQGKYQKVSSSATISVLDRLTLTANDVTINQGDDFDPFDSRIGLKAYDQVDGDLTNKIEVLENNVNPSVAGAYHVTYQVKNTSNEVAKKVITVTVKPFNPWPDGNTDGWKMFSGEDIDLKTDPDNSILESNKVFFADKQASIYKIFQGKDALQAGKKYRVTVYFKPIDNSIPLSTYKVKVSLKANPSSSDYRELINTTLNNGISYQKGFYSVTAEFTCGSDEIEPLINVENFQGGYIGSVSVLPVK